MMYVGPVLPLTLPSKDWFLSTPITSAGALLEATSEGSDWIIGKNWRKEIIMGFEELRQQSLNH